MLDGFNTIIEWRTRQKMVPGHGGVVDEKAVAEHRDMAIALRDRVAALIKKGQTQEQIVASEADRRLRRQSTAARNDGRSVHWTDFVRGSRGEVRTRPEKGTVHTSRFSLLGCRSSSVRGSRLGFGVRGSGFEVRSSAFDVDPAVHT